MNCLLLTWSEAKEANTINTVRSEVLLYSDQYEVVNVVSLKQTKKDPAAPIQLRVCTRFREVLSLELLLPTVPQ